MLAATNMESIAAIAFEQIKAKLDDSGECLWADEPTEADERFREIYRLAREAIADLRHANLID